MAFSVSARTAAQDPRAPEVAAARIPGQPGPLKRYEALFVGGVSVFVFVAVWQLAAFRRVVPELFLPGSIGIGSPSAACVARGSIWPDWWIGGRGVMSGFLLSFVMGLPMGLLVGWYRRLNRAPAPIGRPLC